MNRKKLYFSLPIIIIACLFGVSFKPIKEEVKHTKVLIVTDFGAIKLKLYNKTPLHRDSFIKLVNSHYFDSLPFYRIIENFAIQGGNPQSSSMAKDTISSEISKQYFHKKGALAAGRKNDFENPTKASSPFQFYIVQGHTYTEMMLNYTAQRITRTDLFNKIINRSKNDSLQSRYKHYSQVEQLDSLKTMQEFIMKQVDVELPNAKPYIFTAEQIKAYTTVGGIPHLDNGYTVFGEVTEGLSVIDDIASLPAGKDGKPIQIINMKISIIQ